MGRYSPTVLPEGRQDPGLEIFLEELSRGPERLHQIRAERRAEEETKYQRERRAKRDPVEDAILQADLREKGIVPAGEDGAGDLSGAVEAERDRGEDLLSGRARFGDQGLTPGRGVMAPGSFNPATGTFNSPFTPAPRTAPTRIPLGGGYELDPSQTERGRTEARQQRMIDAMVARGVPREEAEVEVLGGLESAISERFHPGPYHPRTMAEALDYEKTLIRARGEEDLRVAKERGREKSDRDPRWEERRRKWVKDLGDPADEMEQDILDALASGYSTEEILKTVPRSKQARAERYLRKAVRRESRGAGEGITGGAF